MLEENSIFSPPHFNSFEYDKASFIDYWKKRKHVYVCSSKVGSTTLRSILMDDLNIPFIWLRQNQLRRSAMHHKVDLTAEALEDEKELRKRCILYLVRCPFHRVISSYEYRTSRRFEEINENYLAKDKNVVSMNILEYIQFIDNEIKDEEYNSLIEHFFPQKKSFLKSSFEGTKINTLWQTEKIRELLHIWQDAYNLDLDVEKRLNWNIRNTNRYHEYYETYPELLNLVKNVFEDDLEWLDPIFGYEEKFLQEFT